MRARQSDFKNNRRNGEKLVCSSFIHTHILWIFTWDWEDLKINKPSEWNVVIYPTLIISVKLAELNRQKLSISERVIWLNFTPYLEPFKFVWRCYKVNKLSGSVILKRNYLSGTESLIISVELAENRRNLITKTLSLAPAII